MSAREAIFKRLRQGQFQSPMTNLDDDIASAPEPLPMNRAELIALFEQKLRAANADVRFASSQGVCWTIAQWLAELKLTQCWASDLSLLGQQLRRWRANNPSSIDLLTINDPMGGQRQQVFNQVEVGVTSSESAIVETGTIVLIPDIAEPRTMSLVPPVHLVVVKASKLYGRFEDWMADHPNTQALTNIVCITGPSKTADIQQTLAFGAHGPKALKVVIVTDE